MAIIFEHVAKSFSGRIILRDISFNIPRGSIVFILGRSGMGKSVTLKLLMGLYPPDSGNVWIEKHNVAKAELDELTIIRQKCGMVFQHPALFDSMTIFENIAFGIRHLTSEEKRDRVIKCLKLVHLEEKILTKKPSEISYGMQKRVGLARTIAPSPSYILFDEPTTGLDPITTSAINELILELSQTLQTTSVVVSHDMGCALKIAQHILVIDQGDLLAYASVADIKSHPAPLIQSFLKEVV
jgi:phospholipid/cholesterol/gamma-HCH transport system ATP-binding protein